MRRLGRHQRDPARLGRVVRSWSLLVLGSTLCGVTQILLRRLPGSLRTQGTVSGAPLLPLVSCGTTHIVLGEPYGRGRRGAR